VKRLSERAGNSREGSDSLETINHILDAQAGAPLRHQPLVAAAFGNRKAGHSLAPWSRSSDGAPGFVSSRSYS